MSRVRAVIHVVLIALIASFLAVDSSAVAPTVTPSVRPTAQVATPALQPAAGQFVPVPTATVVNDVALAAGGVTTATVVGANGVPAAAQVSAVVVQISVLGTSTAGWVQTYAAGTTRPADSTNSFVSGRYTVTYDVVPVSASGQISLYSSAASRVWVRLRGYVTSASTATAGATFVPLPPTTVVSNVALATNGTGTYTLAGANGIPAAANVAAVALDVVASAPTVAGYLRTYPAGTAAPGDASVYYPVTQTQANYETVKLSAAGQVTFAASGATHLYVRLRGYYLLPTATTAGSSYVPVARATVVNGVALAAAGTTTATLAGANGVPAAGSAVAVAVNVNASAPTAAGAITGYPAGTTRPSDGTVFYANAVSTASHDTFGVSTAGQTTFYASGATKLFVRLRGYYRKATAPLAPTAVTAVGGDGSATVDWATPKDGGAAITGYTITANPGAIKTTIGAENSATVGGLTNGVPYTFTVQAINAIGAGPASAVSKAVVPMGGEVLYAHDLAGRVKAVFTSDGAGAEYVYDAVGNITATKALPADQLKIVQTGNPTVVTGDEYEVYGTGFGLDPAQVSVSVGGVAATIKTLRRNHIVASIPTAAASGAVTVTVSGTTVGVGSVAVLASPQVSSVTPLIADRAATVTVAGSNFAPTTSGNTVTVNGTKLQVLAVTPASLTVKAPNFAVAGKLSVRTKGGTGASTARLTVVPSPFLAADVAASTHLSTGTPATVTLTTSNQIALLTTDGTSGKRIGYLVNASISGCYEAHVWAPDRGAVYAEETLCGTQYIELPRTAGAGTYLLELDPRDPVTGSFTVTAHESADVTKALTIDGPVGSITTTAPASHPTFTFSGTKGQLVFTTLGAGSPAAIVTDAVMWGPGGQKLKWSGTYVGSSPGGYITTVSLPENGTYTIDIDPTKFDVGTYTAQVTSVPAPVATTTTIDGAAGRLTIAKPGQTGSVTFTGVQGQLVHLNMASDTVTDGRVSLRAPDGSFLFRERGWMNFIDYEVDRYTLPQSGEYLLLLEPAGFQTGVIDTGVNTIPADVVYPTTVDAPAKAVGNTAPGQSARLTFDASEGQRVLITCVRDAAHDLDLTYTLLDPTGTPYIGGCMASDNGILFDTRAMTAGTWTVVVNPKRSLLLSPTLQVLSVPADAVVNSALGANPAVTLVPGQNGIVTFPVAAGQRFFIGCTLTTPSQENSVNFELLRPDGTRETSTSCFSLYQGQLVDTMTSPTAGTWSIKMDPKLNATSGVTLRLIAVPADLVKPATVGGTGVTVATTTGQSGRITFTGAANQKIKATVTATNYPSSSGSAKLLDPAGTVMTSMALTLSGSLTYTLPAAGTYTILVDPAYADTGSATIAVANTTLAALRRPGHEPDQHQPAAVKPAEDPQEPARPVYPRVRDASLTGKILRTDGKPLAGVTVRVADQAVRTKADGTFVLKRLPQGTFLFAMDGRTASTRATKYGYFDVQVNLRKGRNKLFYQPYLPILDTANEMSIASPTTGPVVIKTPKVNGLEVHLPAGVRITDADGKAVTRVGITPIPVDRTPIPMPKGVQVPVYFTVQPAGGELHGGKGKIYYPNYLDQKPGTELNFWTHEKYAEGWEVYGTGTVTADGTQVKPDYDTAIENFDGAMINVPGWLEALGKGVLEALGSAGDPVDLGTGRFTYTQSDLTLGGFIPIEAQRAYNSADGRARPFGMGTMGTYDTFLTSKKQWQELDLNLIDGAQVHYVRTSAGKGYVDAAFAAVGTIGQFAGSTVVWNGLGWDLRLRDGTTLVYGDLAPLQSIRDRFGHTVKIRRIAKNPVGSQIGAIVSVTSSEGYWLSYDYDTAGQITAIHDNSGRTVSYTYASGLLKTVTDVNGGVTTYGWDPNKRLTSITDAKQQLFLTNTYDTNGRVIQQKLADGGLYKFDYTLDTTGKKVVSTTVTDPSGAKRTVDYDTAGYLIKDRSAVGTPKERGYSVERDAASHLPVTTTDTNGRTITSVYNSDQQATSTTVAVGGTPKQETATYDGPEGAMDSATDALGNTTRFTFDAAGNVATSTDPEGRKVGYEWNSDGLLVKQTPDGAGSTTYEYLDASMSAVTDPLGRKTSFGNDAVGRQIETLAPDGGVTTTQYDNANQVLSTRDALGAVTTYDYDADGNLRTLKDARGGVTTWNYDLMDQLESSTDQLGRSTSYTYTALGRLQTVTDRRGLTTEFRYDELQRQVFLGSGRTGSPGAYQYQSTLITGFDDKSRLASVDDSTPGAGRVTFGYDDRDRLISETTPQGTTTREWDDADRLAATTSPGLPRTTYGYDSSDRLTSVTRGAVSVSYTYDSTGRLKMLTLPGGVVRTSTYDAASALTGLTFTGTGTPGDLSYHYDSAGRLDRTAGSWARADLPSPVADASFDAANRLTSLDGTARTYDPEGNLISDGSSTYNWNARGELTATSGAVGEAQIRYDALGRRIGTTVDGATWNLQYDGDSLVAEDGPGAQDSTYLMGLGTDSALARVDGLDGSGGASALLTDRLGSVVARTAPGSSDLAAEYSYGTYGAARSSLAGDTNPIRYTGRESGPGMPGGLQFQRARWYEPGTGRFLSEDPAGFEASGPNLYSYVDGDPVDATDPTGAMPQIVAACVVGGAINTVAGVLLGRKHTAGDYLRGLAKGCGEGALMFGVGKVLGVGLRSARGVTKGLDEAAETAAKTGSRVADDAYTHGYKYHSRIRERGLEDPRAHNFPYSFDDVILREKTITQTDGSLLYRKVGEINGRSGTYEIAVNPDTGVIFHRAWKS